MTEFIIAAYSNYFYHMIWQLYTPQFGKCSISSKYSMQKNCMRAVQGTNTIQYRWEKVIAVCKYAILKGYFK